MKMPEKMAREAIAICGVNCLACSAFLDEKKPCPGCHAPKEEHTRKSCANCAKKDCAQNKGLSWCFECEKFPCPRIKSLNKRYTENYQVDLVQNGIDAKKDFGAFLLKQRTIFTCADCGGVIDQHHKRCSDCKAPRQ